MKMLRVYVSGYGLGIVNVALYLNDKGGEVTTEQIGAMLFTGGIFMSVLLVDMIRACKWTKKP